MVRSLKCHNTKRFVKNHILAGRKLSFYAISIKYRLFLQVFNGTSLFHIAFAHSTKIDLCWLFSNVRSVVAWPEFHKFLSDKQGF